MLQAMEMIYADRKSRTETRVEEMLFHLLPTEIAEQGGHRRADHRAVPP